MKLHTFTTAPPRTTPDDSTSLTLLRNLQPGASSPIAAWLIIRRLIHGFVCLQLSRSPPHPSRRLLALAPYLRLPCPRAVDRDRTSTGRCDAPLPGGTIAAACCRESLSQQRAQRKPKICFQKTNNVGLVAQRQNSLCFSDPLCPLCALWLKQAAYRRRSRSANTTRAQTVVPGPYVCFGATDNCPFFMQLAGRCTE